MKIETKAFSKEALVELVNIIREKNFLPESVFVAWYRNDLSSQLNKIQKDLESIEKKLSNKKLSRKACIALLKKYKAMAASGNKKLAVYKELENAAK